MTGDIHSVQFYNLMGLAKADLNNNGKVDSPEEEKIFNTYMKKFDKDGSGKIDGNDIPLYKEAVTFTETEQKSLNELNKFFEAKGLNKGVKLADLSKEDKDKALQLLNTVSTSKRQENIDYKQDVIATYKYLLTQKMNEAKDYKTSVMGLLNKNKYANVDLDTLKKPDLFNIKDGQKLINGSMEYMKTVIAHKSDKLDEMLLMQLCKGVDFVSDKDANSTISVQELKNSNGAWDEKYMDKDEKGKTKDTYILDYIVNRYLYEIENK